MSSDNYLMPAPLHDYLRRASLREPAILARLRAETASFDGAQMQVSPELGQLLAFLVELTGARRVLELGTFTGYSALAMALALPPDGRLVALDGNEPAHEVARRYWREAGVGDRIELRAGEIADTLPRLFDEGLRGRFDLAFVDADKPGYPVYFERCLELLRPGGVIAFDNVFLGGAVAEAKPARRYADDVKAFNLALRDDPRVAIAMLPLGDGVTLARVRPPAEGGGAGGDDGGARG